MDHVSESVDVLVRESGLRLVESLLGDVRRVWTLFGLRVCHRRVIEQHWLSDVGGGHLERSIERIVVQKRVRL